MSLIPASDYYILKSRNKRFYAHVWHQYPTIDKVYVGGRQKCVCFSVYLDDDDDDREPPNLDAVGYDENCNLEGDLLRGHGTKHMMLVAFAFLRRMYNARGVLPYILFKDESKIQCQRGTMNLSVFYTLHYCQTWYQKHFGAYPNDPRDKEDFDREMEEWRLLKHI